ncbi:lysophospholipase [Solitalea sp. MAHUQ-68]|uniref:Lysophospholipase n=1 Tax=Solitalea agri TaxID=2953739 RepID=A0A9X2JCQ2_9SPHI|nr:alpha/beta fold hydrolase [Solitalea agri]MCO4292779.1 lysophospholipase [Solitalea agri]
MKELSLLIHSSGKQMATNIHFVSSQQPKPILIFSHGFKGFKDWGNFPQLAKRFANEGFFVVAFNYSHNGTTPDKQTDFVDLDAFGNNNYSIQLDDLGAIIDFILNENTFADEIDSGQLYLWGHSMGGGISLLKAAEDARVKKVLAWASVGDFEKRVTAFNEEHWRKEGVEYILNARTKQQLPQYYQLYTDFYANRHRLDLLANAQQVNVPVQFIHGSNDEAVSLSEVELLQNRMPASDLKIIEGANHTFGGKHPWTDKQLPEHTKEAIEISLRFLKS